MDRDCSALLRSRRVSGWLAWCGAARVRLDRPSGAGCGITSPRESLPSRAGRVRVTCRTTQGSGRQGEGPPARRRGSTAPRRLAGGPSRSEEHTSELQSQFHLVCRLLLEKKKKKK